MRWRVLNLFLSEIHSTLPAQPATPLPLRLASLQLADEPYQQLVADHDSPGLAAFCHLYGKRCAEGSTLTGDTHFQLTFPIHT